MDNYKSGQIGSYSREVKLLLNSEMFRKTTSNMIPAIYPLLHNLYNKNIQNQQLLAQIADSALQTLIESLLTVD